MDNTYNLENRKTTIVPTLLNRDIHENAGIGFKISRRAKRVTLTVRRSGECIVTVPYRRNSILQKLLLHKAESFVTSKQEWIKKQISKYEKISKIRRDRNGGNLPFGAESAESSGFSQNMSEKELKQKTLEIVLSRLIYFNQFYNFTYKDVRVKKMKSRWGSCSRRGNLNFSHRLALLRPEELDYVVVHELCHLGQFNHSPDFWKLVERTSPDYKTIRKGMLGVM